MGENDFGNAQNGSQPHRLKKKRGKRETENQVMGKKYGNKTGSHGRHDMGRGERIAEQNKMKTENNCH